MMPAPGPIFGRWRRLNGFDRVAFLGAAVNVVVVSWLVVYWFLYG